MNVRNYSIGLTHVRTSPPEKTNHEYKPRSKLRWDKKLGKENMDHGNEHGTAICWYTLASNTRIMNISDSRIKYLIIAAGPHGGCFFVLTQRATTASGKFTFFQKVNVNACMHEQNKQLPCGPAAIIRLYSHLNLAHK